MPIRHDSSGRSYYRPSAFYIWFREDVLDPDTGQPLPHGLWTFMHEYGHLLQDLCSVYGAIDFIHFLDSVHATKRAVRHMGEAVTLPLTDDPSAIDDPWYFAQPRLRRAVEPRETWGSGTPWAYEGYCLEAATIDAESQPVMVAKAKFVDNISGEIMHHSVGPWEIKEAYSVALQVLFADDEPVLESTSFEYVAIDRILATVGLHTPRQRIAMCHWALQHPTPGPHLFNLLDGFSDMGQNSTDPSGEEVYDWCRRHTLAATYDRTVAQITATLKEFVEHHAAAGDEDPLLVALRWYQEIALLSLARNRNGERRFPLDRLPDPESPEQSLDVRPLFEEVPLPSMEDAQGQVFAGGRETPGEQAVFLIRSMAHLVQSLRSEEAARWMCPLYSCCDAPQRAETCMREPWTIRGTRRCPYDAAQLYLDLDGRTLQPAPTD
ncbi:MAG: hypothetical protein ACRBN8_38930 [Nannocystales bacterium]